MHGHLSDRDMIELLDDEPSGALLEHLAGCARCRAERARLQVTLTELAEQAREGANRPEAAWDRQARQILARLRVPERRALPWRWTWAPALIGVAILAGLWFRGPSPQAPSPAETDEALLAAVDRHIQGDVPLALRPAALLLGAVEDRDPSDRDGRQGG